MVLSPAEEELLSRSQLRASADAKVAEGHVPLDSVDMIAGCSQVSLNDGVVASGVVCMEAGRWEPLSSSWAWARTDMAYQSTYLAFREGPAIIKALDVLPDRPDLILIPASGIHHPRGFGMARHIGYLLSIPTVGVTRWPLSTGMGGDASRGFAFSPGPGRRVMYVSPGWGIDLGTSLRVVKMATADHRYPEPIFAARVLCRRLCKEVLEPLIDEEGGPFPKR